MKNLIKAVLAMAVFAGAAGAADTKWNVDVFAGIKKGTAESTTYTANNSDLKALRKLLQNLPGGCAASLENTYNQFQPTLTLTQGNKKIEMYFENAKYTVYADGGLVTWEARTQIEEPCFPMFRWVKYEVSISVHSGLITNINATQSKQRAIGGYKQTEFIQCN